MGWHIFGTRLEFAATRHGLSLRGEGSQHLAASSPPPADLAAELALWTIYRASEAPDVASAVSLNRRTSERLLQPGALKDLEKPLSVIAYAGEEKPAFVAFYSFLRDAQFENVWKVAELAARTERYRYWISYDFEGFHPESGLTSHADLKRPSYQEWMDGAPYLSTADSFSFQLLEREGEPTPPPSARRH